MRIGSQAVLVIMRLRQTIAPSGYGYCPESKLPEPRLFSSSGRGPSPPCPVVEQSCAAVAPENEPMRSSRYVLPQDLDTAIKQLSDQELDKLATAVLEERARRRKTPVAEGGPTATTRRSRGGYAASGQSECCFGSVQSWRVPNANCPRIRHFQIGCPENCGVTFQEAVILCVIDLEAVARD